MQFTEYTFSHVGLVRQANEDSFKYGQTPNGMVYVVCDGMGGHVGGAIASSTAVNAIMEFFSANVYENVSLAIEKSIQFANQQIFARIQAEPELHGMGTTVVVLVIKENDCFIGHVGDSRIYLRTGGRLERITKDHSFVQTLVDSGAIREEDAEMHPQKNQILRALGHKQDVEVTLPNAPIRVKTGDTFLLCSDGLTGMVGDSDLLAMIEDQDLERVGTNMLNAALANGGVDNITGIIVRISQSPHQRAEFVNPHGNTSALKPAAMAAPDFSKTDTHASVGEMKRPQSVVVKRGLTKSARLAIGGALMLVAGALVLWFMNRNPERPVDMSKASFTQSEIRTWPEKEREKLVGLKVSDFVGGEIEIHSDWANEDGKKTFAFVENGVITTLRLEIPDQGQENKSDRPTILEDETKKQEEKKPDENKGKTKGSGELCAKPINGQSWGEFKNLMKEKAVKQACEMDDGAFQESAGSGTLDLETTYCFPCKAKEKTGQGETKEGDTVRSCSDDGYIYTSKQIKEQDPECTNLDAKALNSYITAHYEKCPHGNYFKKK